MNIRRHNSHSLNLPDFVLDVKGMKHLLASFSDDISQTDDVLLFDMNTEFAVSPVDEPGIPSFSQLQMF